MPPKCEIIYIDFKTKERVVKSPINRLTLPWFLRYKRNKDDK